MTARPFIQPAHRYAQTLTEGESARAVRAILHPDTTGTKEPGVMFATGDKVRMCIPLADALRLANEIADIALNERMRTA